MARRRYIQAVGDALREEMERNPDIIVIGEDVELSIVGDLRGLHDRFGPDPYALDRVERRDPRPVRCDVRPG